jgi:hypothetical protein
LENAGEVYFYNGALVDGKSHYTHITQEDAIKLFEYHKTLDNDEYVFGTLKYQGETTDEVKNIYKWDSEWKDDLDLRSDPNVVQTVRELGEEANGYTADLIIEDLPVDSFHGLEIINDEGFERIVRKL